MRSARAGVVLYLVLGVLATVGSILFLLHASFTQWDRRLHVDTDEVVARHLARGAVEALLFAAEQDLDAREARARPDLLKGRISEVLLGDEKALAKAFADGERPASARAFLARLLGDGALGRIDDLTRPWPNAQLSYRASARVVAPPVRTALADVVPKSALVRLECTVQLNHARRVHAAELAVTVGSTLPGVLGRFTVAWAPAGDTAMLTVDRSGAALSPTHPLISFNDPADYSAADPWFTGKSGALGKMSVPAFSKIDELEKALAGRGAVFLSGADPARALTLPIAAGGVPAGQGFQVFASADGKPFVPERSEVASAPGRIRAMQPSQPGTSVRQTAWIEGVVEGFYAGVDSRSQLGPGGGFFSEGSSYVRPLGTAAHPSPGLVYGNARARLAAVSNLAVDRDATSKDEGQQRVATGKDLPVQEVREPPLKHVAAASFSAEVGRELKGASLQELLFFGSEMFGPGVALNENLPASPATERAFSRIALTREFYRYGRMFESYAEYEKVMSRRFDFAYNGLLRFAGMDAKAAESQLMRLAFTTPAPPDDSDLLALARMEHTDPVHQDLGDTLFVDSSRAVAPPAALGALVSATAGAPRMVRMGVTCRGLELFRSSFLTGASLDLGGWWVSLVGATPTERPPALDVDRLTVPPYGGGVLELGSLALAGLTYTGTGAAREPLVIKVGTLRLKGLGPYEGTFVVNDRLEVVAGPERHAVIRGNLVLAPGASLDLRAPLAVVRDAGFDPTSAQAHQFYRARLDQAWDGRLAGSPDLIGLNPYRRGVSP